MTQRISTNVLIIGAGPVGLFQAFQLGLQGIDCVIVESLPHAGGQCAELYADKPIYDIPGLPVAQADGLVERLQHQLQPFKPALHTGHTLQQVVTGANGGLQSTTDKGLHIDSDKVVIATGAGAFTPVKLRVENTGDYEDQQLFYTDVSANRTANHNVVIAGDTGNAITTALQLAEQAKKVTLLHRKRRLDAPAELQDRLQQTVNARGIEVLHGKVSELLGRPLHTVKATLANKDIVDIPTDVLVAKLGSSPKASAFADWGLKTDRNLIAVNPATFETTVPGIYAVGDICTYPAKRKLILCGFHEATMAAFDIAAKKQPDKPVHTLYTTTSSVLLDRLGLSILQ